MDSETFLLVSYGAPEKKEDVIPFLHNLFAGKTVSPERIKSAAEKYNEFAHRAGYFSPLNEECGQLLDGIRREWNREAFSRPLPDIYWGNLFWRPLLEDTVLGMARNNVKHAYYFVTSAFDSEAGNKRYDDAIKRIREKTGKNSPVFEKLPLPFEHPLFIESQTDRLCEAFDNLQLNRLNRKKSNLKELRQKESSNDFLVLFSAHSIPKTDKQKEQYVAQLNQTCRLVIEKCPFPDIDWELVFQSRSGLAEQWLGIDIRDRVREIAATGQYRSIIVSPVGFFCENMETVNDLDWEIGKLCTELGLHFIRVKTAGTSPKISRMLVEMIRK